MDRNTKQMDNSCLVGGVLAPTKVWHLALSHSCDLVVSEDKASAYKSPVSRSYPTPAITAAAQHHNDLFREEAIFTVN
jgi:hypothetical protein